MSKNPMLNPYRYNFKQWIPTILFHADIDNIVGSDINHVIRRLSRRDDCTIVTKNNVIHAWICITWYRAENHEALMSISKWIDQMIQFE